MKTKCVERKRKTIYAQRKAIVKFSGYPCDIWHLINASTQTNEDLCEALLELLSKKTSEKGTEKRKRENTWNEYTILQKKHCPHC